jgi:hypothetical protein
MSLKKGIFSDLKLFSFRDNDQKDASRIIPSLNKGDLIIRDLGYFVIEAFNQIKSRDAFFLSRFKYNLSVFDPKNNKQLDLLKLIRKKQFLDMDVRIGSSGKLTCRLVAIKLPKEIADERKRKAKQNRDKRANHSKEYYELLGYSIFITSVSREIWTPKDLVQAYKARWYIEILFKGWKSNLKMRVSIPERYVTRQRAEFYLLSSLLFINLMVMPIFRYVQGKLEPTKYLVSILKLSAFVNQNIQAIIKTNNLNLLERIKYYCAYETRQDRLNAMENICFVRH